MTFLELDGVSKEYVDARTGEVVTAIGDVSFGVEEGEFVAVLGPSGCGKTTLLNIIAGFIAPTKGSVRLRGRNVQKPGADRGVVFQNFALFPWKTVLGNVEFGLRMRGIPKRQRQKTARGFLKLVGISGFEHRYPHELSGGMQQRVGVARVLANEPDVLLMDEPFASVDAQTRMKLQQDLTDIWEQRNPTVLFVTHDVEEASFLSDRVIVLSPRPSMVRQDLAVTVERPRRWDQLVEHGEFRKLVHTTLDLLGIDEADTERGSSA